MKKKSFAARGLLPPTVAESYARGVLQELQAESIHRRRMAVRTRATAPSRRAPRTLARRLARTSRPDQAPARPRPEADEINLEDFDRGPAGGERLAARAPRGTPVDEELGDGDEDDSGPAGDRPAPSRTRSRHSVTRPVTEGSRRPPARHRSPVREEALEFDESSDESSDESGSPAIQVADLGSVPVEPSRSRRSARPRSAPVPMVGTPWASRRPARGPVPAQAPLRWSWDEERDAAAE